MSTLALTVHLDTESQEQVRALAAEADVNVRVMLTRLVKAGLVVEAQRSPNEIERPSQREE